MRRVSAVCSAVLAVALLCVPAVAPAAGATLRSPQQAIQWSDVVTGGIGPVAEVPECATGCTRFDLRVDLPANVWHKPGGLQVAVRWEGNTLGDNLRLYVQRNGSLIARSDRISRGGRPRPDQ